MEDPIIACDVSKGKSHIQGFIGLSKPIGNPFEVRHLKSDLKLLKELAKSLEKEQIKSQNSFSNSQAFTTNVLQDMFKLLV